MINRRGGSNVYPQSMCWEKNINGNFSVFAYSLKHLCVLHGRVDSLNFNSSLTHCPHLQLIEFSS